MPRAATNDRGKPTASERMRPLERLACARDEGSLRRSTARMRTATVTASSAAAGRIAGARCSASPRTGYAGGSVGAATPTRSCACCGSRAQARVPVIGFVESGGARMQEGLAALDGYARIFSENVALSGRVPQITVITGTSAGGGCYSPALTDFVVMTRPRRCSSPVRPSCARRGRGRRRAELGGPRVHERNGVCQFVVDDDVDAIFLVARAARPICRRTRGERAAHASGAAGRGPTRAASCRVDGRARSTTCAT